MASTIELLLLAALSGTNAPALALTDGTTYNSGNVTTYTQISKAWPLLPGAPVAGTVYVIETEYTGVVEGNAWGFGVEVNGSYTGMTPNIGAGAFSAGTAIGGWLRLAVRVASATSATAQLSGSVGETATSVTSASTIALSSGSKTLTLAAGYSFTLGVSFGASTSGQTVGTWGSSCAISGAGLPG